MRKLLTLLLLIALLSIMPGSSGRSVQAYYNGQEATVSGIVVRPGEPFTVDLSITPDGEAEAYAELDEPGTPRAYDRLGGDDLAPAVFKYCNASYGARYHWVLAANGHWVNGTAPVNIYYQINRPGSDVMLASGYFTVVDAYIVPGVPAADPGEATEKIERAPGPCLFSAVIGILAAILIRRRAHEDNSKIKVFKKYIISRRLI